MVPVSPLTAGEGFSAAFRASPGPTAHSTFTPTSFRPGYPALWASSPPSDLPDLALSPAMSPLSPDPRSEELLFAVDDVATHTLTPCSPVFTQIRRALATHFDDLIIAIRDKYVRRPRRSTVTVRNDDDLGFDFAPGSVEPVGLSLPRHSLSAAEPGVFSIAKQAASSAGSIPMRPRLPVAHTTPASPYIGFDFAPLGSSVGGFSLTHSDGFKLPHDATHVPASTKPSTDERSVPRVASTAVGAPVRITGFGSSAAAATASAAAGVMSRDNKCMPSPFVSHAGRRQASQADWEAAIINFEPSPLLGPAHAPSSESASSPPVR